MDVTLPKIKKLFSAIDKTLFTINPVFDYDRTIDALNLLSRLVHDYPGDNDDLWAIGEGGECSLDSLLIGAYWFCCDYHGGQSSPEYACQCAIGQVFSSGMASGPEPDSSEETAYNALETICPHSDRTEF